MNLQLIAYAVACVVIPVAWGLLVSWILNRFQMFSAKPTHDETTSSIDLHERS